MTARRPGLASGGTLLFGALRHQMLTRKRARREGVMRWVGPLSLRCHPWGDFCMVGQVYLAGDRLR